MQRLLVRLLTAALVAAAVIAVTATPATAATSFTCRYVIFSSWSTGFHADLFFKNTGTTPITGWTVHWTFEHPTQITNPWSSTIAQSDQHDVVATNLFWNATVIPGGSLSFGWIARATATTVPSDITVNGLPCPVG